MKKIPTIVMIVAFCLVGCNQDSSKAVPDPNQDFMRKVEESPVGKHSYRIDLYHPEIDGAIYDDYLINLDGILVSWEEKGPYTVEGYPSKVHLGLKIEGWGENDCPEGCNPEGIAYFRCSTPTILILEDEELSYHHLHPKKKNSPLPPKGAKVDITCHYRNDGKQKPNKREGDNDSYIALYNVTMSIVYPHQE